MGPLPLLFYLCTVLALNHGSRLDVERPITFQEAAAGFGQSVVQFGSASTGGLLVGAPLQKGDKNETGKVYKCSPNTGRCQEIPIQRPPDAVNMSLGLSLAAQGSQFLACGPTVHQACGENMYIKGYCFLLDQNFQQLRRIPDTLPECPKHLTDIVFLIDGSSSISFDDFARMKTFITEVIRRFRGTNTLFALMQFSSYCVEHFDFNKFKSTKDIGSLIYGIKQLNAATLTATAIQKVVKQLFISQKGSRDGAAKILIVVTDGRKNDYLSYSEVIPEAERAGIIRYAIGVGRAFSLPKAQQELHDIASEPTKEHVFQVNDFDALRGIQNQLQEKIFAIEGTLSQSDSSFQLEMSQDGFSSLLSPDESVLGAVGAYDWSGGIFLYGSSGKSSFINVSRTSWGLKDAYLGYSAQLIISQGQRFYVVGAPRYNHIGKVFLFRQDTKEGGWQIEDEKSGEQVGSYFGGTLCSVDLDGDGNTDLVLIGAPTYYTPLNGGCVHICLINQQGPMLSCTKTLKGQTGQKFGRFGASMSAIGDINGDGQMDVAIGAPMESDNCGAVYIFHGEKRGFNSQYRQRIEGSLFPNRLRYFGQAISGGTDLTGDGLLDIAVGAEGQVLLLRSQPVLRVGVSISFQPPMIPAFDCQGQEQFNTEASSANVCFTVTKITKDSLGDKLSSTIKYNLALDAGRTKIRAAFGSNLPFQSSTLRLVIEKKCETYRIILPLCPEDTLNPITLHLNYTLMREPISAAGHLTPILSEDSPLMETGLLPFQKDCGQDGRCDDQLEMSFNFSGVSTLVVGVTPELNITISIQNRGENSYSTVVRFFYPAALSYRRVLLVQVQSNRRPMTVKCSSAPASEEETWKNTTCHVNHPIFWSGAEAIFIVTIDVSPEADLGDRLQIMANASSDNGGPITEHMNHQKELPVKYGILIILTSLEDSTKYINFSTKEEGASVTVTHRYEVRNLRQRRIPISITFQFPVELNGFQVWDASEVIPSKPQLAQCINKVGTPGSKDFMKQMNEHPRLDCSVATCKKIQCTITSLEMQQPLEFTIKGNVSFQWVSETQQKKVTLVSEAQIGYEEKKYTQKDGFVQCQVQTVVERSEVYNSLPIIVGSSVGGLVLLALIIAALYKVGFFKRQYKQKMEDAVEGKGAGTNQSAATDNPAASDGPKQ